MKPRFRKRASRYRREKFRPRVESACSMEKDCRTQECRGVRSARFVLDCVHYDRERLDQTRDEVTKVGAAVFAVYGILIIAGVLGILLLVASL